MSNQSDNAFSIRRLNPFNGTLQVFTTEDARALSSNGVMWEIQVLSDTPQGLWANTPFSGQEYYTFGLWSKSDGLHQVPLNPLFNAKGMLESAQQLTERLEPLLTQLPFSPADVYELWLLDEVDNTPFALLDSARSRSDVDLKAFKRWSSADRGNFTFVSPHLHERGLPENDGYNPRVHASVLEEIVRNRCGQNHLRAWFLRDITGNGQAITRDTDNQPASAFPELPVSLDWTDPNDHELIMDYIAWQAPRLLMLHGLSADTREMIEKLAVEYPVQVERFWRLFPEIHNKTLLNKARVEARIRNSNQ